MHIAEIHLEHFRSFAACSVFLHPHVNVVVGRNGSGKSNLVEAVAFVLQAGRCDASERRHVVHEKSARTGHRVSTTVRLVVDNSDRRLPVDEDRVTIARTLGAVKEDALFLQGKRIRREELQSLLEVAGFSRFNPYYFVKQGQVTELATCTERRRLEVTNILRTIWYYLDESETLVEHVFLPGRQVIRELTGIRGFEQSRTEAQRKMAAAEAEIKECDEGLEEMERSLEELREDSDDLKAFSKLDGQKRAIELVLGERHASVRAEHKKAAENGIRVGILKED